tara:strand:- start:10326 stop:10517 length:192 start_codon:yes stop_codon:yes gene_type:complete
MKLPRLPQDGIAQFLIEVLWPIVKAFLKDTKARSIAQTWAQAKTPEEKSDALKKLADHQNGRS